MKLTTGIELISDPVSGPAFFRILNMKLIQDKIHRIKCTLNGFYHNIYKDFLDF